jgi:heat shock protein 5
MIKDSEKFAEQDKVLKEKIDAKNSLENYIYTMRNTIEDKEKLAEKIESDDKEKIKDALTEAQDWLTTNAEAEKEDLEQKLKDL